MIQGSEEWLRWRSQGLGASDAPVIMGVSPYLTPYQLWAIKTGLAEPQAQNYAMARGLEMEAQARAAYEAHTGNVMQPACLTNPACEWMRASVDGITLDGDLLLEIKCPGSQDHALAVSGQVPEKYFPQIQHQMIVAGVDLAHYWSYDGTDGTLISVPRDLVYCVGLLIALTQFWDLIQTQTAPPLCECDTVEREDEGWVTLAQLYIESTEQAKSHQAKADIYKARMLSLVSHPRTHGGGLKVVQYPEKGRVNYARVDELKGVELDRYRSAGCIKTRITIDGDE